MISSLETARNGAIADSADKSERVPHPEKILAFYLSPVCEHDWSKLADERQTLGAEGKTIWTCRSCDEIAITYEWQTPAD